jgi:hypothetical protein
MRCKNLHIHAHPSPCGSRENEEVRFSKMMHTINKPVISNLVKTPPKTTNPNVAEDFNPPFWGRITPQKQTSSKLKQKNQEKCPYQGAVTK